MTSYCIPVALSRWDHFLKKRLCFPWGSTIKRKNLLPEEQILSFKSWPSLDEDQLAVRSASYGNVSILPNIHSEDSNQLCLFVICSKIVTTVTVLQ